MLRIAKRRRYNETAPQLVAVGSKRGRAFMRQRARRKNVVPKGQSGDYASLQEKKVIDLGVAGFAADTTGTVTLLNSCDEGSGPSARVGRVISMRSVQMRGSVRPVDTMVTGANCIDVSYVRVLIVYDRQPNGAAPTVANILSASNPASFQNLDFRDRFKVISDEHFIVGPRVMDTTATQAIAVEGGVSGRVINLYKDLQGLKTVFDGTGGGIADINTGALFQVTIGSQAAGVGANVVVATRVRFTDS